MWPKKGKLLPVKIFTVYFMAAEHCYPHYPIGFHSYLYIIVKVTVTASGGLFFILLSLIVLFCVAHSCSRGTAPWSFCRSSLLSSRTACPSGRWWPPPPAWYVATPRELSPGWPPLTGTRTITTKPSWASAAAEHRATINTTTAPVSKSRYLYFTWSFMLNISYSFTTWQCM